ncbi:MAG TPA: heparin lyase I family protein [Candidatus Binatus sp.]|jgi:hypothetical protein|nr:heparin lyase I family protein [Candidatus Binatus sp.]
MRRRIKFALLAGVAAMVLIFSAAILARRVIPLHIHDDFESSSLTWRWTTLRLDPGAAQLERQIVRSGHQAIAITVHDGDRYEAASDSGAATERDELMENWPLFSRTGHTYVYSFSLLLPNDLPSTAQRLVIAQWRQLCEARHCSPDYPILAIRYQQGLLEITRQDGQGRHVLYQSNKNYKGHWLDFRFVIKFDAAHGSVRATLNRAPIVDYAGPTLFAHQPGYPAAGSVYFKTGLYRDAQHDPAWTIYVDDYRKDQCLDSGCE